MARTKDKNPPKQKASEQAGSFSRRTLLKGMALGAGVLAAAGGAGTLAVRWLSGPAYNPRFLSSQQYQTLEAACERILPADRDPGAQTIGAAIYIDRLLAEDTYTGEFLRHRSILTKGLDALDSVAKAKHGKGFTRLSDSQQDALLRERADPEFLSTLVKTTLDGVFYDPFYGGNRDGMGWRMLDFSPTASFKAKGLALPAGATHPS